MYHKYNKIRFLEIPLYKRGVSEADGVCSSSILYTPFSPLKRGFRNYLYFNMLYIELTLNSNLHPCDRGYLNYLD
jgi:hypothetical protein